MCWAARGWRCGAGCGGLTPCSRPGQLRLVQRELTDLGACLERVSGPLGRFQYLQGQATLALATGRFADAVRLGREGFTLFSDTGHPTAFGALAVVLGQAGLLIGLDRSGFVDLFAQLPAHLRPEVVDTTQGIATIFPALSLALIRLHEGDRAGAEAAYALAGPIRSWNPSPAMRMAAWGHGLAVAISLGRPDEVEFLISRFEPFRGQHAANGAGAGVYMGPVELQLGMAYSALGRLDAAAADLEQAVSICDGAGAFGCAVQARLSWPRCCGGGRHRVIVPGRGSCWTARPVRLSGSAWCRSASGSRCCRMAAGP